MCRPAGVLAQPSSVLLVERIVLIPKYLSMLSIRRYLAVDLLAWHMHGP
jgi:hypothetical protein